MSIRKTEPAPRNGTLLALLLCLSALCFGAACHAQAGSNPWIIQQTAPSLSNSNTYALWVKQGATDSSGNYSGDTASIWTMDAKGNQVKISPTYGPFPGWTIYSVSAAPSSTSRLLWVLPGPAVGDGSYSGDSVSLWSLNAVNVQTSISPTYTLTGGHSAGLTVLPDGSERLEWDLGENAANNYSDPQLSLWSLDASNNRTAAGPIYGPFF